MQVKKTHMSRMKNMRILDRSVIADDSGLTEASHRGEVARHIEIEAID